MIFVMNIEDGGELTLSHAITFQIFTCPAAVLFRLIPKDHCNHCNATQCNTVQYHFIGGTSPRSQNVL